MAQKYSGDTLNISNSSSSNPTNVVLGTQADVKSLRLYTDSTFAHRIEIQPGDFERQVKIVLIDKNEKMLDTDVIVFPDGKQLVSGYVDYSEKKLVLVFDDESTIECDLTSLCSVIEETQENINSEIQRAQSEEKVLEDSIQLETERAIDEEGRIEIRLEDEISRAQGAEEGISIEVAEQVSQLQQEDIRLQSQIDAITSSSDVVDVVGTKSELDNYDTTKIHANDIIKVLTDESKDNAISYYRWTGDNFSYIGSQGPFYTKAESDTKNIQQDNAIATNEAAIALLASEKANDSNVVHNTGDEAISGTKTFSGLIKANGKISSDGSVVISPSNQNYNVFSFSNTEFLTWKSIRPAINGELTLGTAGSRWKDLYLSGNLSDGTNNITVADICDKSKVVANPGSATTDLTSISIDGINYTIKSIEIDVAPYKANSPIIKGISLNGVDYNIMPRDSAGSIIIGPASYVEGNYDNIIALTNDIGNFYNHDGSIYLGNNINGGTGNTTAHQIIIGANAATKSDDGTAVEGIALGSSAVAGNTDTIAIGHDTANYLQHTVTFDTPSMSRSIHLESPHNIIFRGEQVGTDKTNLSSYTDVKYLDELLPPLPTSTVANKYLKANNAGTAFEYADIALPTNAVTTDEQQTITGIKKFSGTNRFIVSYGTNAGYDYAISSDIDPKALTINYKTFVSETGWNRLLTFTTTAWTPAGSNSTDLGGNVNGTYYYWKDLYIDGAIKRNINRPSQQETATITLPEISGQIVVTNAPTSADAAKIIRVNSTGTGFELADGSSGEIDPESVCEAIENMSTAQKDRVKEALGFVSGDEREY